MSAERPPSLSALSPVHGETAPLPDAVFTASTLIVLDCLFANGALQRLIASPAPRSRRPHMPSRALT